MTTIDSTAKTVTRKGSTWSFTETGKPKYFARLCAEYGDQVVGDALTARDYYPPMMDKGEMQELDDQCSAIYVARSALSVPKVMDGLADLGYTHEEAVRVA